MARKEKYTTHVKPHLEDISNWIRDGEPEYVIYKKLGISETRWYEYKKNKEELRETIKKGQQKLALHIESKLYQKCTGIEFEESKTLIDEVDDGKGNIKKKKKIEKIKRWCPPDTVALIFACKNLNPEKWKDKQEIKHEGEMEVTIIDDID